MSTTTKTVNATLIYGDYTERTYKIPVNSNAPDADQNIKPQIQAFNQAAANSTSSVAQTFLSDSGAPVTGIKEATLIERTEDIIYAN